MYPRPRRLIQLTVAMCDYVIMYILMKCMIFLISNVITLHNNRYNVMCIKLVLQIKRDSFWIVILKMIEEKVICIPNDSLSHRMGICLYHIFYFINYIVYYNKYYLYGYILSCIVLKWIVMRQYIIRRPWDGSKYPLPYLRP